MVQVNKSHNHHRRPSSFLTKLGTLSYALALLLTLASCSTPTGQGITDLVWVPAKQMMVAGGPDGIYTSIDQGSNWHTTAVEIDELTLAVGNQIWGRQSYRHPHGGKPGPQYLVVSEDGINWQKIELDPAAIMPVAFLSSDGEPPVLLSEDGKIWAYDPTQEPTQWTAWSIRADLHQICEGDCSTGMLQGSILYLAKGAEIIQVAENGQLGKPFKMDVRIADFASDGHQCWAISIRGTIYTVICGQMDWQVQQDITQISTAEAISYDAGELLVVGESDTEEAVFSRFSPNDTTPVLRKVSDMAGDRVFVAVSDGHGTYWAGTQYGIYRGDGQTWERKFP